jgi:hypothetical protein
LQQAVASFGEEDKEEEFEMFRTIVRSLVSLYDPLSAKSLSKLLSIPIREISALSPTLGLQELFQSFYK